MLEAESHSPVVHSGTTTATHPERSKIGFVGLGHMGTAMAANLAAAGRRVIAYFRRSNRMDKLAGAARRLARTASWLPVMAVTMLPDDDAVPKPRLGAQTSVLKGSPRD
jgi:3-hydroxyisobutyrate dehydrogenase-like beta-hydroxyacid dehydrogenase